MCRIKYQIIDNMFLHIHNIRVMFILMVYSVFNTDSDGTLLAVVVVVLVVVVVVVIGVVVVVLNLPHLPKNRDTHFPCRRT